MVKVLLSVILALLIIICVILIQVHYQMNDMMMYLDSIYLELSICEDLGDEYILPTQGPKAMCRMAR